MNKAKELDQFYTSSEVAAMCVAELKKAVPLRTVIEPSAGTGAFSNLIPNCIALDLEPKAQNIRQCDFFEYHLSAETKDVVVVGNPPYGKNSSLAIRFFNHAASMADVIAFVVPLTFRKESTHNRLDKQFHLLRDIPLPRNSFVFNEQPYDVPSCFQIWVRRDSNRLPKAKPPQILSKTTPEQANLVVRRVGGRAGFPIKKEVALMPSSLFLSAPAHVLDFINSEKYSPPSSVDNTAGMRSITVDELNHHLAMLGFSQ